MTSSTVRTSIKYLERLDLYTEEKPFKIAFDVSHIPDGRQTNHKYVDKLVNVANVRGQESKFTIDQNGFEFRKLPTKLTTQDFQDDEVVKNMYYPEVRSLIQELMPEGTEVVVFGHKRRLRKPTFPDYATYAIPLSDPVVYVHADFTPDGAKARTQDMIREHEDRGSQHIQMLNLWRVIKGPNRDWPLACCDFQTLDASDVELNDVVHRDHVGENAMIYPNAKHQWYYIDDQEIQDVIVFRHCDSGDRNIPFAPHVSFDRTAELDIVAGPGRESIEAKIACFLPD